MCLVCIEVGKGTLKEYDARIALAELKGSISPEHLDFVTRLLDTMRRGAERSEPQRDSNLDYLDGWTTWD